MSGAPQQARGSQGAKVTGGPSQSARRANTHAPREDKKSTCPGARPSALSPGPSGAPAARGIAARHVAGTVLEAAALLAVPVVLGFCAVAGVSQSALLSFLVVIAALAVFFGRFEASVPRLRDIMPNAVLAALAAAGRVLFAPVPDFKPVSAIAIVAGAVFGRRSGFMVGALAALVSNFFFGQGPWTPWQMYAWGMVGYLAGLLARTGAFRGASTVRVAGTARPRGASLRAFLHMLPLYVFGFVSGPLYGLVLNSWSIIGFYHPQSLAQAALVYAAALPFDVAHGVSTVVFLAVLYAPWHRKLERVRRKYDLR